MFTREPWEVSHLPRNRRIVIVLLTRIPVAMKALIRDHKEAIQQYTKLDYARIQKITTLCDFDREVQCITWGYPTVNAYYRDASSVDSLFAIRIPFLALNAKDDPVSATLDSSASRSNGRNRSPSTKGFRTKSSWKTPTPSSAPPP